MTVGTLNPHPFRAAIIARLRQVGTRLAISCDAFVEARMRASVPERYLRHEERGDSTQPMRKSPTAVS